MSQYEFRSVSANVGVLRTGANTNTKPQTTREAPNPYDKAARQAPSPFNTPGYRPHGQPPDGYAIALARLRKEK